MQNYRALTIVYGSLTQPPFFIFVYRLKRFKNTTFRKPPFFMSSLTMERAQKEIVSGTENLCFTKEEFQAEQFLYALSYIKLLNFSPRNA